MSSVRNPTACFHSTTFRPKDLKFKRSKIVQGGAQVGKRRARVKVRAKVRARARV